MKFSIITVCFNAAGKIENTIKSVLNQTYDNVEYIIVDGASTDGTREIIEKYAGERGSDGCSVSVKFISEPDRGLYDAMNKGVRMASGDYVEFLNAGDELYDENVLKKVAERIKEAGCKCVTEAEDKGKDEATDKSKDKVVDGKNIYYGNILYMNPDGTTDVRLYGKSCGKAVYFATGDCVNHQAIFAARDTLISDKAVDNTSSAASCNALNKAFRDDEFKICADRDWMMRATKNGAKWIPLNETVVKYDLSEESISVRDTEGLRKEERLCLKKNYPILLPVYGVFDFCRHNKTLAKILHGVYEKLYLR